MSVEDDYNFVLIQEGYVAGHSIIMENGELFIDGSQYQEDPEDPTYDLVREIRRHQQIFRGSGNR